MIRTRRNAATQIQVRLYRISRAVILRNSRVIRIILSLDAIVGQLRIAHILSQILRVKVKTVRLPF